MNWFLIAHTEALALILFVADVDILFQAIRNPIKL